MTFNSSDLKILCSMRIRLNADERKALKDAYRKQFSRTQSSPLPLVNRGSGISVSHSQHQSDINQRLGLPHIVVVDILSSRDAISLPTLLLFQQELGVAVVTDDDLSDAFKGYIEHVKKNVVPSLGGQL